MPNKPAFQEPQLDPGDGLIKVKELCHILAIGRRTAETWLTIGKLPAPDRFGRCRRWSHQEIQEYLNRLKSAHNRPTP